jgi:hypothetical protein
MIAFKVLSTLSIGEVIITIVGLCTLLVALKVHREFAKNHARAKQVEVMSDLLEVLNTSKIYIFFQSYSKSGGMGADSTSIFYNIFEIGNLLKSKEVNKLSGKPLNRNDYDDAPVLINSKCKNLIDINQYIDNPFVPRNIADLLVNFRFNDLIAVCIEELMKDDNDIVVINSIDAEPNFDKLMIPNCEALKTWLGFKSYSHNLIIEIEKWFKDKGIDDINLRIDYKNIAKPK